MTGIYNGKCPLCSGQLYKEGELLRCGRGHYQVGVSAFEEMWERYLERVQALDEENILGRLTEEEFLKRKADQAVFLLEELQDANLLGGKHD